MRLRVLLLLTSLILIVLSACDQKKRMIIYIELSQEDFLKSITNNKIDSAFVWAIEEAKANLDQGISDFFELFEQALCKYNPDTKLAEYFSSYDNMNTISYQSDNKEVMSFIRNRFDAIVDGTIQTVEIRCNSMGMKVYKLQKTEKTGVIYMEIAHTDNPNRLTKIIESRGKLEFWETYEISEIFNYLLEANKEIKAFKDETDTLSKNSLDFSADTNYMDETGVVLLDEMQNDTSIYEANTYDWEKEYPLLSILYINVDTENMLVPGPVIGMANSKDTAEITKLLNIKRVRAILPRDLKFYWTYKPIKKGEEITDQYQLIAIKVTNRDGKAPIDGSVITDAKREFGIENNVQISMSMNKAGAKMWEKLTKQNIGRSIAIIFDDYVYSYPTVNTSISGGKSMISGDFTIGEAEDLAGVLNSGSLPCPVNIIKLDLMENN